MSRATFGVRPAYWLAAANLRERRDLRDIENDRSTKSAGAPRPHLRFR